MEALIFLLDYDGTLVPIVSRPELAAPDDEVLELLREIAARAEVHVVSGRTREVLDAWLGALPVALHAEHGLWSREMGGAWRARFAVDTAWLARIEGAMQSEAAALPGAHVEKKSASLAWHYRNADPAAAARSLERLRAALKPLAAAHDLDLLDGSRVLEVRDRRANKGEVAREIATSAPEGARIVAFGDDTTDEDMFAALPNATTIKVGAGPTRARERVTDVAAARSRMRRLALGQEDPKPNG